MQPDPQLQATAAPRHPLYQQAFDAGTGVVLPDSIQNGVRCLGDFGRGAQVEHDAVYGRLVEYVWRAQLDRDWIADLLRGQGGLNGIGDDPGRQGGEPSCLQNGVCQMGVEGELLAFQRLPDQQLALVDVKPVTLQRCGGFHQLLLVTAVLHHVHEGSDRALRGAVGGESCLAEQPAPLLGRIFPRPVGQDIEASGPGVLFDVVDQASRQGGSAGGE